MLEASTGATGRVTRLRCPSSELRRYQEETIRRLSPPPSSATWRLATTSSGWAATARSSLGRSARAERRELLRVAAPLHDVGKIAIPDAILLKPGALTRRSAQIERARRDRLPDPRRL